MTKSQNLPAYSHSVANVAHLTADGESLENDFHWQSLWGNGHIDTYAILALPVLAFAGDFGCRPSFFRSRRQISLAGVQFPRSTPHQIFIMWQSHDYLHRSTVEVATADCRLQLSNVLMAASAATWVILKVESGLAATFRAKEKEPQKRWLAVAPPVAFVHNL